MNNRSLLLLSSFLWPLGCGAPQSANSVKDLDSAWSVQVTENGDYKVLCTDGHLEIVSPEDLASGNVCPNLERRVDLGIVSMQRREDGSFDVICRNGKILVATSEEILSEEICRDREEPLPPHIIGTKLLVRKKFADLHRSTTTEGGATSLIKVTERVAGHSGVYLKWLKQTGGEIHTLASHKIAEEQSLGGLIALPNGIVLGNVYKENSFALERVGSHIKELDFDFSKSLKVSSAVSLKDGSFFALVGKHFRWIKRNGDQLVTLAILESLELHSSSYAVLDNQGNLVIRDYRHNSFDRIHWVRFSDHQNKHDIKIIATLNAPHEHKFSVPKFFSGNSFVVKQSLYGDYTNPKHQLVWMKRQGDQFQKLPIMDGLAYNTSWSLLKDGKSVVVAGEKKINIYEKVGGSFRVSTGRIHPEGYETQKPFLYPIQGNYFVRPHRIGHDIQFEWLEITSHSIRALTRTEPVRMGTSPSYIHKMKGLRIMVRDHTNDSLLWF